MNTVVTKLEAALKAYVAANYQGVGEELNGATLYEGHRTGSQSEEHRIVFEGGALAGPHAEEGNYEVAVAITVITNGKAQPADAVARVTLHEKRVEALAGIFGASRVATVKAALMVLDTELGVSSYWGYDREQDYTGPNFETTLRKTFAVHLV